MFDKAIIMFTDVSSKCFKQTNMHYILTGTPDNVHTMTYIHIRVHYQNRNSIVVTSIIYDAGNYIRVSVIGVGSKFEV